MDTLKSSTIASRVKSIMRKNHFDNIYVCRLAGRITVRCYVMCAESTHIMPDNSNRFPDGYDYELANNKLIAEITEWFNSNNIEFTQSRVLSKNWSNRELLAFDVLNTDTTDNDLSDHEQLKLLNTIFGRPIRKPIKKPVYG